MDLRNSLRSGLPSATKRLQVARPIPLLPPVISATFRLLSHQILLDAYDRPIPLTTVSPMRTTDWLSHSSLRGVKSSSRFAFAFEPPLNLVW